MESLWYPISQKSPKNDPPGGDGGDDGGGDGRISHRHQPPHPITPRDSISRSATPHSDIHTPDIPAIFITTV